MKILSHPIVGNINLNKGGNMFDDDLGYTLTQAKENEDYKELVYDKQYDQLVEVITPFHCVLKDGTHVYEF